MRNKKLIISTLLLVAIAIILGTLITLLLGEAPKAADTGKSLSQKLEDTGSRVLTEAFDGSPKRAESEDFVSGNVIEAILEHAHDGDTIWVHTKHKPFKSVKIRVIGIDTPEINRQDSYEYAVQAKEYTEKALANSKCYLEFDKEIYDQYDRVLAHVWTKDPREVNYDVSYLLSIQVLRDGYAKAVQFKPNTKYGKQIYQAQDYARDNKIGLWAEVDLTQLKKH